jgi:ADP-ribose pyrophosphatase
MIAREVEFAPGKNETYHAVNQPDYLAIVAQTPSGHFPIVRQYRPALEDFTWELPAGLAEAGEDPAEGCKRELLEETGYVTRAIHSLEAGIACKLVTAAELVAMIKSGEFVSQLHLGALLLAELRSFISLK